MEEFISACMLTGGVESNPFDVSKKVCIFAKELDPNDKNEEIFNLIKSRIWITYRKDFESILSSGFTSDKGWGCMIRCGQMVYAEVLLRINLGQEWIWNEDEKNEKYLKIIKCFEDSPSAPLSIHNITKEGLDSGVEIGEWYGPNRIAQTLRKMQPNISEWCSLNVNIIINNFLIMDELRSSSKREDGSWKPLLIFVQTRLGVSEINPIYYKAVFNFFSIPQCVGIIGGYPKHALYFIGSNGDNLLYLDPHTTQDSAFVGDKSNENEVDCDKSYHCNYANAIPICKLDPSLALCFLCLNEAAYDSLIADIQTQLVSSTGHKMIEIYETKPKFLIDGIDEDNDILMSDSENSTPDDDNFEVLE